MKQITLKVNNDTIEWGSWGDLKELFLHEASEHCKAYHGDVFITYNQLRDCINEAQANNKDIDCYVSFHESGADFINMYSSDKDLTECLLTRIINHEGQIIRLCKPASGSNVEITLK